MATTMNAAAPTTTARSERYRDAERRLWAHQGLEEVTARLTDPAVDPEGS